MLSILAFLLPLCTLSDAASIVIDGTPVALDPLARVWSDDTFVPLRAMAGHLGWDAKIVVEGKLIVLCKPSTCRPLHVQADDIREHEGTAYVRLEKLAASAGYAVLARGKLIVLKRQAKDASAMLEVGSILPDVLLTDLSGERVRTSDFLGRRVLFCTWASW